MVEVVVVDGSEHRALSVSEAAAAEISRLESIFSMYRSDSELRRWIRDETTESSPEFCEVMEAADAWQARSAGAFNPLTGVLTSLWSEAQVEGRLPSDEALAEAVESIAAHRYEMRAGRPVRLADCSDLNLNAIAKGYIVDRAIALAAERFGPRSVLLSAGGDLAHRGPDPMRVGIENPLRPYDNEPPLMSIALDNAALATSGGSRRGTQIDGRRFGHVIDPRSGRPVEHQASISVVAPTAMEADVMATVAGVMDPAAAVAAIDQRDGFGCLVVDAAGGRFADATWRRLVVSDQDESSDR